MYTNNEAFYQTARLDNVHLGCSPTQDADHTHVPQQVSQLGIEAGPSVYQPAVAFSNTEWNLK